MDAKLLQTWLRLPDGDWPPAPHVLLGLDPGTTDAAAVEARVLERMAVLRRHQNRHPELVTEGMNRLAQALVALADPGGRANESPPSRPPAPPTVETPNPHTVSEPDVGSEMAAGPDEPVAETHVHAIPDEALEPLPVSPVAPRIVEWSPAEPPPGAADPAAFRRQVYRRRRAVRACLRHWHLLEPYYGHPEEPLDRPEVLAAFLLAVADARSLPLPLVVVLPSAGRVVSAALNQKAPAEVLRQMLPDQRQAVAVDWQRGRDGLTAERDRLLTLAAANRPRRWRAAGLGRVVTATPEYGLALAGLLAAALLLAKGGTGR